MQGKQEGTLMRKSKDMCVECRNNIYNDPSLNPGGVKSCSHYKTAKVKKRILVGSYQNPPYSKSECKDMLSCYYPRNMVVAIDCGSSGYTWKE